VVKISSDFYTSEYKEENLATGYNFNDIDHLRKLSLPYLYSETDGIIAGRHNGAHFYTIGQRKGLNIGGYSSPLYIISTDSQNNIIYVGEGQTHPGLFRKALFIERNEIHNIRPDIQAEPGFSGEYLVRIRYRQPLQRAMLFSENEGLYILFHEPQRSVTAGQFATWYRDDELIGSGEISK
jgi:tRNA-specific 2-thiouridylase